MQFQVYSVCLEDRYPRALPRDVSRGDLLHDDFPSNVVGVEVEKREAGCVAFVFGRCEDGRSVCARVEGVRPKLYYEFGEGDTVQSLRRELASEIGCKSDAAFAVTLKEFAHDYGYEFDASTPSRRRTHTYAEVSYPSKATWQMACKLRRARMLADTRARILDAKSEIRRLQTEMLSMRQSVMRGNGNGPHTQTYDEVQSREEHLRKVVLAGLEERAESLSVDDDLVQDASDVGKQRHVRFAHEYFVDPITRFLFEADIRPASWVSVPCAGIVDERVTTCDVELVVGLTDFAAVARDLDAPYTVLNYDIETLGLDPATSSVIQISMVFVTLGTRDRHLLAIGRVSGHLLEGITVHECSGEESLLRTFRMLVMQKDPDFVVAYNGVNFDNQFLAARADAAKCARNDQMANFWHMSRFALRPSRLRELRLSSSGMGDNVLRYFDLQGRTNFDWFVKLKRDLTSEPKYSLNHFAKKFCGLQKEDMDYKEIPVLQNGTPDDRARLGKYCVVDSELLEDLNQARTMITEILQFSFVFGVVPEWVYFRGQQVRFVAQLLKAVRTCEEVPLLLNRPHDGFVGEGTASFQGATVNVPKRGFYKDVPIATLDWASLYPSIMRAHNLCHSTYVMDPSCFDAEDVVRYEISKDFVAHFVSARRHKGVLPRILEELGEQRKVAKRRAKKSHKKAFDEEIDPSERQRYAALAKVFDCQQLAFKVSMNSIYGACGSTSTGKFPNLAISATVTLQGRKAMDIKKEILPTRFPGIDVIYGDTDSVMVAFADAPDVQTCGDRGEEASKFVTEHFALLGYPQMILEFEKCYFPYLLEGKKRYAGLKFEPDVDGRMQPKGIDCKGIETERKDTLPFVKDIMHGCLNRLMYDRDERAAFVFFDEQMRLFMNGEVDFDKFIMRKNLSAKASAKPDQLVHARVNALMREREPGSEANVNEQVEYVIVNGYRKSKTTELAESPVYAKKHGLRLNLLWYFEHAIRAPITKIFELLDGVEFEAACARYSRELDAKRLGVNGSMRDFMRGAADARPADAAPVVKRSKPAASASSEAEGPLRRFFSK